LGKLGFNLPLLLSNIINFGLLAWLLWYFLYNPVKKALAERTRRIQESMENAEQVRQQLQRAKEDYDAEIAQARREAQTIINQANERAKVQEVELVAEARVRVEKLEAEAHERMEQERQALLRNLQTEIAELVAKTAGLAIGHEVDPKAHQQLIADSIAQLGRLN